MNPHTERPQEPSPPGLGGETLRALAVFSMIFLVLVGLAGHLAFRELSLSALESRLDLGREEARRIADAVAVMGWGPGGIDFHRVRRNQAALERVINNWLSRRSYVLSVEVRDRFGGRLLFADRALGGGSLFSPVEPAPRAPGVQVVSALLRRGPTIEGEVLLGISDQAFSREVGELRRTLRIQIAVAAAFGLLVLALGFVYVLHLIRKNRMLERQKLDADRRAFAGFLASGLAHEIRNPLNAMNMNLQMLEEELGEVRGIEDHPDCQDLLTNTQREIRRLEGLVNSFLSYARLPDPKLEPRDLNDVARELARLFQADFASTGVAIELDLEPALPAAEIDEIQLKQAVMNLLVNARQALRNGGRIVLRTLQGGGGEAILEVEDDGPGIPAENIERIFEVFFSNRGGGTGLGLPIARKIVEGHGGRLQVDSEPGRRTVFRIRLPKRPVRAGSSPAPQAAS